MMKNTLKQLDKKSDARGVTLIALVVTIIVLLILAGVAISMLRGENGIIKQAQKANEATTDKGAEEKVGLSVSAARAKGVGVLTVSNLKEEVENSYGGTVTGTEFPVTVTIDGKAFLVTTDGGVTSTKETSIGSYVQYDVPYRDMYSGQEYTATNGWRYLGKDDSGNQLIVSTGIPAILYYHFDTNIGNVEHGGMNSWWPTENEISSTTDALYKTDKGYYYYTDNGEPNKYAAYGMRYKFGSIPFSYQADGTSIKSKASTGIFRKVGDIISGENISLNFEADGAGVVDVHILTLAELNRATGKASGTTRTDTSRDSGFKDLTGAAEGLFDMKKLKGYTDYWYWLASPYTDDRKHLYNVTDSYWRIEISDSGESGVRPVVTLKPNVQLTVVNQENV